MSPHAVELAEEEVSRFNRRFQVSLADGSRVEAVLYRGDTLCVSCQVGCAVRCPFCASGARGLGRGLTLAEMTAQVEGVLGRNHPLKRVTVSGVGEPLHNAQTVADFVTWSRARGLGVSLTTTGGPLPRLREWLHRPHNGITISVHAGTEATRARMVPKGPSLGALFDTLREELPRLTARRRRKLALAYLLVAKQTDRPAEVEAFLERAVPLGLTVHLYAYNPVSVSGDAPVPEPVYRSIYARMQRTGLRIRMSSKARTEVNGGCGTLVALRPTYRRSSSQRNPEEGRP